MGECARRLFPGGVSKWDNYSPEQVSEIVVQEFKLSGQKKALFIGHFQDWMGTSLT